MTVIGKKIRLLREQAGIVAQDFVAMRSSLRFVSWCGLSKASLFQTWRL